MHNVKGGFFLAVKERCAGQPSRPRIEKTGKMSHFHAGPNAVVTGDWRQLGREALSLLGGLLFLSLVACSGENEPGPPNPRSSDMEPAPRPSGSAPGTMVSGDPDHGTAPPVVSVDSSGSQQPVVASPGAPVDPSELQITPSRSQVTVTPDQPQPAVTFELFRKNQKVAAPRWIVQDADIGSIEQDGVFTPSGKVGGVTTVSAYVGETHVSTTIRVELVLEQNGGVDDGTRNLKGGYGGVGGEGPGGPVDAGTRAVLDGAPTASVAVDLLYPYNETVFPLGLFAPLLMWNDGVTSADAVRIRLYGDGFEYKGYFARPPALGAGLPFVRHPIPQEIWQSATLTVRGGDLNLEVTVAAGGKASGPMTRRFIIANGSLKGTVYYQSYGTSLAANSGRDGVGGPFGAATLAIRPGEAEPRLIAGANGCRVCHSVSSQGTRLVTQTDERPISASYDLRNNNQETQYADDPGVLAWIGLSPDGSVGLGNARPLLLDEQPQTQLYDMNSGDVIPSTGLTNLVTKASFPAFSHQGDRVVFSFESGPGNAAIGAGNGLKLVTMQFDRGSMTFSNPRVVHEGTVPAGWPSFSPDDNAIVFQAELQPGRKAYFETRRGGFGELWWANLLDGTSHRLAKLNGDGYLPATLEHPTDQQVNYEPTVSPIATGGYAWVVFMSRRLYGNVATVDAWTSDPRDYDNTQIITPKKLWVAALDLNLPPTQGQPETPISRDPSHPAFYLPGQELYAGNARGFWVQDPCKPDGESCESGIDCCTGFCQADLTTGKPTCGRKEPGCVQQFERCQIDGDCCDPTLQCINSVCSLPRPKPPTVK